MERKFEVKEKTTSIPLTPQQQSLNDLWEQHIRNEFTTKDTHATLDTMVPEAYVNHIPVLTGGSWSRAVVRILFTALHS
jgi:carboxymethylenebutenolidase